MADNPRKLDDILRFSREREKELECLYRIEEILKKPGLETADAMKMIVAAVPSGWQYPEVCRAKIDIGVETYAPAGFSETPWAQRADIFVQGKKAGEIAVYYSKEMPPADDGPFLTDAARLLRAIADRIGTFIFHRQIEQAVDDLVCGSALWQALGSPKPVTLSANDEVKTVFFATRDNAGNISTPISDQIELDTEAPVLTSYDMRDRTTFSNDCSNNGLIRAYFSYTDDGDAVTLQWSYDGTTFGTWEALMPSPDSADGSVPAAPDGYKLLYIRLVDDIGNLSNIMVDSIYVDGTAPTLATVAAEDIGATASPDPIYPGGVTNATTFTIKLTGLSADVTALMISEDGGTNYTTYPVATAGAATFDYVYTWLSAYTGCTWYPVFVKTVDCAGNMSGAFNGNVYFDIPAPAITAFTGPALTNVLTVSLSITATDNCGLYQMRLGEGSLVGVPWIPFNAAPSFTLAAGDTTEGEMIASVKRGVYVTRFHYVNVEEPMKLVLTGMTRDGTFLIEDGRLTQPLKNLRFTQGVLEALSHVAAIGSERVLVGPGEGGATLEPALLLEQWAFTGQTG